MSHVYLACTNRADTATLSGPSFDAGYPLINLQDSIVSNVARTASAAAANTRFKVDLGSAMSIDLVAIARHNLTAAGTMRVFGSTSVIDYTDPGPFTLDTGAVTGLQMTFQGDQPAAWGLQYNLFAHFAPVTVRYLIIAIADTANADGHIDLGRLFIGKGFQPAINAEFGGVQHGRDELSSISTAIGGPRYGMARVRPRYARFGLDHLTQTEGDRWHEMQAEIGITGEVVYLPDPDNKAHSQRYGFLGNLSELDAIAYPYSGANSTGVHIKEKL